MCVREGGILLGGILVCRLSRLLNACTCVVWAIRICGSEESDGHFLSPRVSELTAAGKQFDEIILVVKKNSKTS